MALETLTPQMRIFVYKMIAMWAVCGFTWASTINATPLILKDIVGTVEAAEWQGKLTAVTAVVGMVMCPALGYLSDKWGRMGIMNMWLMAFAISIFFVFSGDWQMSVLPLILARMVPLSAASTVVFALTADVAQGSDILAIHGYLGGCFGSAALLGSGITGIIARVYSRKLALAGTTVVACIAPFIAISMQKEKIPSPTKSSHTSYLKAARFIATQDPLLRSLIVAFALLRVGNVNSMLMFTLYSNYKFNWDLFDVAAMLGVVGTLGVIWQLVGVKYIVERYDNVVPFLVGTLGLLPLATAGYGLASQPWHLWVCGIFASVGGVTASIFTTKISVLASDDGLSGTALGLVGTLQNGMEIMLSIAFGNLLGWVFAQYPKTSLMVGLPYYINACTYLISILFVLYGHIKHGHTHATWTSHTDVGAIEKGFSPNSMAPHTMTTERSPVILHNREASFSGVLTQRGDATDVDVRKHPDVL